MKLSLLETAILAAIKAGHKLMDFYQKSLEISQKEDNSPITEADIASNNIILSELSVTNLPILSEEAIHTEYAKRSAWQRFWLVDPLDGTKEFIQRNGEFTVNIALIEQGKPVIGVIYSPVTGELYAGSPETKSFKVKIADNTLIEHSFQSLPIISDTSTLRIVVSRSHLDEQTIAFIKELKKHYPETEVITSGSSIKLCKVAEGSADGYPRFGKTMEWDTAAGHAILIYAEANLYEISTLKELRYNKPLLSNPEFIALRNDFVNKLAKHHV